MKNGGTAIAQVGKFIGVMVATFVMVTYFQKPLEDKVKANYIEIEKLKGQDLDNKISLMEQRMDYEFKLRDKKTN